MNRPNMGQYATHLVTQRDMVRRNIRGSTPVLFTVQAGKEKNQRWHDHCIVTVDVVECRERVECTTDDFVHRNISPEQKSHQQPVWSECVRITTMNNFGRTKIYRINRDR
jgi:hypothetical protein